MRWGDWFEHDAESIVNRRTGVIVARSLIAMPNGVAVVLLEHPELTAGDAAHLLIAANALEWDAFNFHGIGDWTDDRGRQLGASRDLTKVG